MKRIGRSWYRIDSQGRVIGVVADITEAPLDVDRPGARGLSEWWVRPDARRPAEAPPQHENPIDAGAREYRRTYEFFVDQRPDETQREALIRKVQALADRGATQGERDAAYAALLRLRAAR